MHISPMNAVPRGSKNISVRTNQNTRKDTLLKRQQFVTKNQETSVKTELSPDKRLTLSNLYYTEKG